MIIKLLLACVARNPDAEKAVDGLTRVHDLLRYDLIPKAMDRAKKYAEDAELCECGFETARFPDAATP